MKKTTKELNQAIKAVLSPIKTNWKDLTIINIEEQLKADKSIIWAAYKIPKDLEKGNQR